MAAAVMTGGYRRRLPGRVLDQLPCGTPLTSLRLQIQIAERAKQPLDPAKLVKQPERLVRPIEDMLDISRIDAGKLELERGRTDLASLAGDVLDRFSSQAETARCAVVRELAPGVVGEWDAYRLEQVLTNLVTNALRYAPGAPIQVSIARNADKAFLAVQDHGPGVAPQDRERIFRRFERGTSPRNVGGLGLGLLISRQIVEAHGGRLTVEGMQGAGARFVVELPLR